MDQARTFGWGLIGASDIAREYMIPAIKEQPDGWVAAVMSRNITWARRYASENSIPRAYDTLEGILADPDVDIVYISSTNEWHKAPTLAAAATGKHVLCEKPLALSVEDAVEMVQACRRAGVVMGTNHHMRNAVTHRTLHKYVADGKIGRPLAARVFHAFYLPPHLQGWRLDRPDVGGGVILDLTVHDADALRFILKSDVEEVTALAIQQGMAKERLEDGVMGVMRFGNDVLAQFHDAYTISHAGTGLEVHGTEGSLFASDAMTGKRGLALLVRGDKREEIDVRADEKPYVRGVRAFADAVRSRGEAPATGEDGVWSLAVALAVRESVRTGRACRPALDPAFARGGRSA